MDRAASRRQQSCRLSCAVRDTAITGLRIVRSGMSSGRMFLLERTCSRSEDKYSRGRIFLSLRDYVEWRRVPEAARRCRSQRLAQV